MTKASELPVRFVTKQEQLVAQARLRQYSSQVRDAKVEGISKSTIAQIGEAMWSHTYRTTSSDEAARDNWVDYVESLRNEPERHFVMSEQMKLADAVILMLGGARWFGEGLPVYRLGHKRTAAFMATNVSVDMAEHVKPPFRAFYIELPDGLIEITNAEGKLRPAIGVFVHVVNVTPERDGADAALPPGEYWRWICMTRADLMLWEMNRHVDELIAGTVIPEDEYFGIGWEMDDHDLRVRRLVTRLIVSLCLDLASGKTSKRKLEPTARAGKKAAKGGPSFNVFLDPTEIDIDARPYVRAFLAGDRKSPDFQQLVKGHWKNQAYGPGLSLRKPIQILPYKRLEHLPEKAG
jgi:hypothetical protein